MKVSGNAVLHAAPEQVWAALNDPDVLVRTIPGCERLEAVGADRYRMTVTAGVASIRGTYLGDVALTDHAPYSSFVLRASGSGAPGTVSADVRVSLDPQDGGTTLLTYDADAVVGGTVGGVGQRVLGGVARRMAGEFFSAVDAHLTAPPSSAPSGDGAEGAPPPGAETGTAPAVFTRPDVTPSGGGIDLPGPLPAALMGAAIALVGVLIGWRLGRRP